MSDHAIISSLDSLSSAGNKSKRRISERFRTMGKRFSISEAGTGVVSAAAQPAAEKEEKMNMAGMDHEERMLVHMCEAATGTQLVPELVVHLKSLSEEGLRLIQEQAHLLLNSERFRGKSKPQIDIDKYILTFGYNPNEAVNMVENNVFLDDVVILTNNSRKRMLRYDLEFKSETERFELDVVGGGRDKELKKSIPEELELKLRCHCRVNLDFFLPLRIQEGYIYYLRVMVCSQPSLFGVAVDDLVREQDMGYEVPVPLIRLREAMYKNRGLMSVGVFRDPSLRQDIAAGKRHLDEGTSIGSNPYLAANLMKQFFKELPTKIINFVDMEGLLNFEDQLECVTCAEKIPKPERDALWFFVDVLADVAAFSTLNEMGAKSLANSVVAHLFDVPSDCDAAESLLLAQRSTMFVFHLICNSLSRTQRENLTKDMVQAQRKVTYLEQKPGSTASTEGLLNVMDSSELYDMVCRIDSLNEIVPPPDGPGTGWYVKLAPGMEFLLKGDRDDRWSSSVVTILGLYNKGKTFVLNNLADVRLKSGTTVHTEGLSFKVIKNDHCNHILLDTAGLHAPVLLANDMPESALALKKATEYFLEDLAFLMADYYVVVVNDLTSLDQEYIEKLVRKLKSKPLKVQQIILIHNFKEARTKQQLDMLWEEQVVSKYRTGRIIEEVVVTRNPKTGQLEEGRVQWLNTVQARHVYLANDESPVGRKHNPWVFGALKRWLSTMFVPVNRTFSPMQHFLDLANNLLNVFVENRRALKYDMYSRRVTMPYGRRAKERKVIINRSYRLSGSVYSRERRQPPRESPPVSPPREKQPLSTDSSPEATPPSPPGSDSTDDGTLGSSASTPKDPQIDDDIDERTRKELEKKRIVDALRSGSSRKKLEYLKEQVRQKYAAQEAKKTVDFSESTASDASEEKNDEARPEKGSKSVIAAGQAPERGEASLTKSPSRGLLPHIPHSFPDDKVEEPVMSRVAVRASIEKHFLRQKIERHLQQDKLSIGAPNGEVDDDDEVEDDLPPPRMRPAIIDERGFTFVDADFVPVCDVYTSENGLHILMDAPDLDGDYFVVRYGWDTIRVTGQRQQAAGIPTFTHYMRKYGTFKKEFHVPGGFLIFDVKHWYADGVIHIFLPRAPLEETIPYCDDVSFHKDC